MGREELCEQLRNRRSADEIVYDPERLWRRLSDEASPAIWFQLLPIAEMGAADEVYIKMNSRGKSLTAFEVHLGPLIAAAGSPENFV